MDITFRQRNMQKVFNSQKELERKYGPRMTRVIQNRMTVLRRAQTLNMVPTEKPERCHPLKGDRRGQFAVDLVHPQRLVFEPNHDPVPRTEDGGVDKDQISAITIIEVIDYH